VGVLPLVALVVTTFVVRPPLLYFLLLKRELGLNVVDAVVVDVAF
jgi:hypothetical protein